MDGGVTKVLLQIFSQDRDRADLLRVHPAQGRRRLRRGQLQGAVRVDRGGPDPPRRAQAPWSRAEVPMHASRSGKTHPTRPAAEGRAVSPSAPRPLPASATASRRRRCPARCLSAATRRRSALRPLCRAASPARPSPRRARPTSGPWLYRIRPTVTHWARSAKVDNGPGAPRPPRRVETADRAGALGPIADPAEPSCLHPGLRTITTAGDAAPMPAWWRMSDPSRRSMVDEYFYNADG